MGARGPFVKHFCNWLVVRGVGGNTTLQYLQYFFNDIRLLIVTSNRLVSHFTIILYLLVNYFFTM